MKLLNFKTCKMINDGQLYLSYRKWIEENFSWALQKYRYVINSEPSYGKTFILLGKAPHIARSSNMLCLIRDPENDFMYIIGIEGLEF